MYEWKSEMRTEYICTDGAVVTELLTPQASIHNKMFQPSYGL